MVFVPRRGPEERAVLAKASIPHAWVCAVVRHSEHLTEGSARLCAVEAAAWYLADDRRLAPRARALWVRILNVHRCEHRHIITEEIHLSGNRMLGVSNPLVSIGVKCRRVAALDAPGYRSFLES